MRLSFKIFSISFTAGGLVSAALFFNNVAAQAPAPNVPKVNVVLKMDVPVVNALLDMVAGKIPKKNLRPISANGIVITPNIDGGNLAIGVDGGSLMLDTPNIAVQGGGAVNRFINALSPAPVPALGFNKFSFAVKESMRNAVVVLNFGIQALAPQPALPNLGNGRSALGEIVKNNPAIGEPLAKVMAQEMGGVLPGLLDGFYTGAFDSAVQLTEHMNHVLRVLTLAPPQAAIGSVAGGVGIISDAFNKAQFEDFALPVQPAKQSLLRQATPIAGRANSPVAAARQHGNLPGVATAFAETPSPAGNGESLDPFLNELQKLGDTLFAPITLNGVTVVVPSGQPTKALTYLKDVEQKNINTLRSLIASADPEDPTDQQLGLNVKMGELIYDIKSSLLGCTYDPKDADKKIKRFLVDDYLKPALQKLLKEEEMELDIYNADSNYGGQMSWGEEEQQVFRDNKQSGSNNSADMVHDQVAQNRISRARQLRQSNSYSADGGAGSIYNHNAGRMTEDASFWGSQANVVFGDADNSLAAYAKVVTKYIAEDALDDWANSPGMDLSAVYGNVSAKIKAKFLATQAANDAEKKKIIDDAASKALSQVGFSLAEALKNGDAALAAYGNILEALQTFEQTYCKHKEAVDNVLKAADNMIAAAGACDPNKPKEPEDPVITAAKEAAGAELKKAESCQSAAATFINLTTIAKKSLLQILRQQINHIYGLHGLRAPTDAELDALAGDDLAHPQAMRDLYNKFYENDAGVKASNPDGSMSSDEAIADARERTINSVRGIVQIGLRAYFLRYARDSWLVGLDGALKNIKQAGDKCVANIPNKAYSPTLSALFAKAKAATLESAGNAPSVIKQKIGDVKAKIRADLYGSAEKSEDRDLFALEQQLKAADELIMQMLGFVRDSQSDLDAGVAAFVSIAGKADASGKRTGGSVEVVGKFASAFDQAKDKSAQVVNPQSEQKLAADSKEGGRTGALARQKLRDKVADEAQTKSQAEGKQNATGLTKEAVRSAVTDVGDEAKNDLDNLKASKCPSGCSPGKKYVIRGGVAGGASCTNGNVTVGAGFTACCDFGEAVGNPATGKVDYVCANQQPPNVTHYDNVVRITVTTPQNALNPDQYGYVYCANLPRPNANCQLPDAQTIADAFCGSAGNPVGAGNASGYEFYKMKEL